jgi:Putative peptidoglycan binding domain
MKTKLLLFLSCFAAVTLTTSAVSAAPHGGHGGGQFASMPARGGHTFTRSGMGTWSGQRWGGGTWSGRNWNGNWRHHNHNNNDVIFIGSFGFPFWGWGWGWGYPYGYGYGYPYGGYGYGYPYGYGYDYNYGNYYGDAGYGDQGYGYSDRYRGKSSVAQLQRRLARAGYYSGAIDGIMGPETRRAIRAYERSQNQRAYGMTDRY